MKKPWSISTTVRNPERLRDFLRVLKELEGENFDTNNQQKYQILLIKNRIYKPNKIPFIFKKYYDNLESEIPYSIAEQIFNYQKYEDPPMRGRQSVNPLNKLGFSIARENYGPITITELGNNFISNSLDIGDVFFKSLLKLQFPNPWSSNFSSSDGFNIRPFIAILRLFNNIKNNSSDPSLSKTEFCLFIPTLINYKDIDNQTDKILIYRNSRDKAQFITNFLSDFYNISDIPVKKINNLFDYGDNIMRYLRLTRYFNISIDILDSNWNIELEPTRDTEIKQLLNMYDGSAFNYNDINSYISYLSDINKPKLPWEDIFYLSNIINSLKTAIFTFIEKEKLIVESNDLRLLNQDITNNNAKELETYLSKLRELNIKYINQIKKLYLINNKSKIEELISILRNNKSLKKFEPEQFEKLITEALKIINDEILIKPNYPVDDKGDPISHSPAGKPDIECFYKEFYSICEVTLNTSKSQWILESQPVMRHFRDFENTHKKPEMFCLFISPKIHTDTLSIFWYSVKNGYDGRIQKIIPLNTEQFSLILETILNLKQQGKAFAHSYLKELFNNIINITNNVKGFSNWQDKINDEITNWKNNLLHIC